MSPHGGLGLFPAITPQYACVACIGHDRRRGTKGWIDVGNALLEDGRRSPSGCVDGGDGVVGEGVEKGCFGVVGGGGVVEALV